MKPGKRLFLTGLPGSGKSSLCQQVIMQAKQLKIDCRGVLSPAVIENGEKVGIDLVDLSTGHRTRLADRNIHTTTSGPATTRWAFHQESIDLGNAILRDSIPCELLVIDELGPLEFERGEGWLDGLTAVDEGEYQSALLVIRPSLLTSAFARWRDAEQIEIHTPNQVQLLAQQVIMKLDLPH